MIFEQNQKNFQSRTLGKTKFWEIFKFFFLTSNTVPIQVS